MVISRALLEYYPLLIESDKASTRDLLIDLERAIESAKLTEVEYEVISKTYFSDHAIPFRSGGRGRPAVGVKDIAVLLSLGRVSPGGRRANGNTEYHLAHRSIKRYKKVLNNALSKIDKSLGYVNEDITSLRDMWQRN